MPLSDVIDEVEGLANMHVIDLDVKLHLTFQGYKTTVSLDRHPSASNFPNRTCHGFILRVPSDGLGIGFCCAASVLGALQMYSLHSVHSVHSERTLCSH